SARLRPQSGSEPLRRPDHAAEHPQIIVCCQSSVGGVDSSATERKRTTENPIRKSTPEWTGVSRRNDPAVSVCCGQEETNEFAGWTRCLRFRPYAFADAVYVRFGRAVQRSWRLCRSRRLERAENP